MGLANSDSAMVFLCHSDKDHEFVRRLAADLLQNGVKVWFDEWEMKVGDSLAKRIQTGIKNSAWLAVILSPDSVESPWVERELNAGMARELERQSIFVLPILCRPCAMPLFLEDKFYANFTHDYGSGLAALLKRVSETDDTLSEFPKMLRVPAGLFFMGSDAMDSYAPEAEKPGGKVHVPEYLISKYPVTIRQYDQFLKETSFTPPEFWQIEVFKGSRKPVVGVTWENAKAYCAWLSKTLGKLYRLPYESEWEKAARGYDQRLYPWDEHNGPISADLANYGNHVGTTTDVDTYRNGVSYFGCYDMIGNVWEWCEDEYLSDYHVHRIRQSGSSPGSSVHSLRGGAWSTISPEMLRVCARPWPEPRLWLQGIGFRVVADV